MRKSWRKKSWDSYEEIMKITTWSGQTSTENKTRLCWVCKARERQNNRKLNVSFPLSQPGDTCASAESQSDQVSDWTSGMLFLSRQPHMLRISILWVIVRVTDVDLAATTCMQHSRFASARVADRTSTMSSRAPFGCDARVPDRSYRSSQSSSPSVCIARATARVASRWSGSAHTSRTIRSSSCGSRRWCHPAARDGLSTLSLSSFAMCGTGDSPHQLNLEYSARLGSITASVPWHAPLRLLLSASTPSWWESTCRPALNTTISKSECACCMNLPEWRMCFACVRKSWQNIVCNLCRIHILFWSANQTRWGMHMCLDSGCIRMHAPDMLPTFPPRLIALIIEQALEVICRNRLSICPVCILNPVETVVRTQVSQMLHFYWSMWMTAWASKHVKLKAGVHSWLVH